MIYKLHDDLDTAPQNIVTHYLGESATYELDQGEEETKVTIEWDKDAQRYRFYDTVESRYFGSYREQHEFITLCIGAALELNIRKD